MIFILKYISKFEISIDKNRINFKWDYRDFNYFYHDIYNGIYHDIYIKIYFKTRDIYLVTKFEKD